MTDNSLTEAQGQYVDTFINSVHDLFAFVDAHPNIQQEVIRQLEEEYPEEHFHGFIEGKIISFLKGITIDAPAEEGEEIDLDVIDGTAPFKLMSDE